MLARAVKPNCDGLHDMAKQLLIWAFKGKRKYFSEKKPSRSFKAPRYSDENSYFNSRNKLRSKSNFDFSNEEGRINWSKVELAPFSKNFYNPHPNVLKRSKEEIEKFWKEHDIKVVGKNCPAPIFSFEEAGFPQKVIDLVSKLNYSKPTPIQQQGWPIALSGFNMVGIARTGSGKTLAFILPALIHVENQPPLDGGDGPVVLVVAPTRELTMQIHSVAKRYTAPFGMNCVPIYGGSDKFRQEQQLRRGAEICIATPGRLLDFLNNQTTNLRRCTYLVLDEADRMLDMGFEPQLRSIINQIRPDRQVLMWSATWPKEIRNLAEEFLGNDYIRLVVGSLELTANPNIKQVVRICNENEKLNVLEEILRKILEEEDNSKILIFADTKFKVDSICKWLRDGGCRAECIHSDKTQRERERILDAFRRNQVYVLVATNVAARGLDISDIKHVINFDHPSSVEDYIHRIGRTGRHDAQGTSYTFITYDEGKKAFDLLNVLKSSNQEISAELEQLADERSGYSRGFSRNRFGFRKY